MNSGQNARPPAVTMFSDEENFFRKSVRDFAEREILPLREKMDQESAMDTSLISKLFELGIMGIETPEIYGGTESSFTMACLAIEEIARVDGSVSVLVDVQNTLVTNALLRWANDDQKKRYLPHLSSHWVASFALSESSSGSDAFALKLQAQKDGDGYVLNGHKLWITNAHEADLFLVFANTDASLGHKGIRAFLVERTFEGFEVGKKENKMGIRASSTCELIFNKCRVPQENVVGPVGQGHKIAIETLNEGRIGIAAQMLGMAQGAYDATLAYIKSREQFNHPLSDFQGVQFLLARMRTELESIRVMVYNAARLKDAGQSFAKEAAMAKLLASEKGEWICSRAIDLFGGNGFVSEYPVEKFFRDVKIGQIYEGTTHMQLQTIAKLELSGN